MPAPSVLWRTSRFSCTASTPISSPDRNIDKRLTYPAELTPQWDSANFPIPDVSDTGETFITSGQRQGGAVTIYS